MISNHSPVDATLASSCRDSSIFSSPVIRSHNAVPYSEVRSSGMNFMSSSTGASQSMSSSGSYELRDDEPSNRAAVLRTPSSGIGAAIERPPRPGNYHKM
jgi:hypothetical protein